MAALECKVAMVISRLVKLELHLELKFEQKKGTSCDTPCETDATSYKTEECLSVPVILGEYRTRYARNSPSMIRSILYWFVVELVFWEQYHTIV
jgi:hypothetical protein